MIFRGLESAGINEKLSLYPFLLCWISAASDHSRAMQNPDLTLDVKARTSAFSSSTENTEKSINNKQTPMCPSREKEKLPNLETTRQVLAIQKWDFFFFFVQPCLCIGTFENGPIRAQAQRKCILSDQKVYMCLSAQETFSLYLLLNFFKLYVPDYFIMRNSLKNTGIML